MTMSTAVQRPRNPTQFEGPAFLLNAPFSFSTEVANNIWMEEIDEEERRPDYRRAMAQFLTLYRFLAAEGMVYLLPTPRPDGLQDLVFTANLGIVLEHLPARDTVVVSNFTSPPRAGETGVGVRFFESMGYRVVVPETKFEGEAELKHLHDDVYVGGYGIRSQRETYEWMERTFDMTVVPLAQRDPHLYHLDCAVFPITREQTLVCTGVLEQEELRLLEKHTEVVDVSVDAAYTGLCNSVRLNNLILNASHVHELSAGSEEYRQEIAKNRELEDVATRLGFEIALVNLSEYHKSGALLSCMVMHLNRHSYRYRLL
ncbi:amidinotransferase [Saccharopolyspora erythraea]|uniref:dimethylarginine dimethylaminohydrolase family protein n=1 Tax=Saccharopolyspora erythraea TaxID=1836 RepID=UPI001BAAD94D|nr:arginine deiminase-related protein [Saccharopolyspora erythraea]QUG99952.1 amidinotransferase [Saccharopolyspora erythraea]